MEFHPVCKVFPKMSDKEFLDLIEDIATNGQMETIKTYQGKIIDGRNRFLACQRLNIEPITCEWNGNGSLISYVMSLNLHRRHLTPSQRAGISLDLLEYEEKEAKERQKRAGEMHGIGQKIIANLQEPISKGTAASKVAETMGISERYIHEATSIKKKAPELIEHIKDGTLTIPEAKIIARDFEPEERPAIIQKFKEIDEGEKKPKVLELVGAKKKEQTIEVDERAPEIKEYDEYLDACERSANAFVEAMHKFSVLSVTDRDFKMWKEMHLDDQDAIQNYINDIEIILPKVLAIKKYLRGLYKGEGKER